LILVIASNGMMQGGGTLLGRSFSEGRRHSSWPERAVVLTVFCSALFFFGDIDSAISSVTGTESEFITVIFLVIFIPVISDLFFRIVSSLLGIR